MPSPRDITGELSRLPKRRLRKERAMAPEPPHTAPPQGPTLRAMAFDPFIWLTGILLLAALGAQFAFVIWMW